MDEPVTCGHCGREITQASRGWAADGTVLCHTGTIPPDAEPPDCYRLVEVYLHQPDGSCCRNQPAPPWRGDTIPGDFYGCSRDCLNQGTHTLKWGSCEHAQRPAPHLGYFRTAAGEDGSTYGYTAEIPLLAVLPWAKHLTVDQQHQMLEEASDSDDPAAVIAKWKRQASAQAPVQINMPPAREPDPGFGPGHIAAAYEHGRRQGRYEAGR